jgi:hypothetical protein
VIVHCPGCDRDVTVPDIGPRTPPGIEIDCACGDAFGVLYSDHEPVLIWWKPSRPLIIRNIKDDER